MTLNNCKAGETVKVDSVCLSTILRRRLEILGVTSGSSITLLRKKKNGTAIVYIRGARYAFGAALTRGILASRIEEGEKGCDGK